MYNSFLSLPIATIERVLTIRKEIETIQASLNNIFGGAVTTADVAIPTEKVDGRKAKKSPATLAKMAAAQRARWAKKNAASPAVVAPIVKAAKKKRTMSPEGRARIAAAQKARWAKSRKA